MARTSSPIAKLRCRSYQRWEISRRSLCVILRGAFIVNEEESEEHEIGDWESDPRYHVDRLRHSNRMRRVLFP